LINHYKGESRSGKDGGFPLSSEIGGQKVALLRKKDIGPAFSQKKNRGRLKAGFLGNKADKIIRLNFVFEQTEVKSETGEYWP